MECFLLSVTYYLELLDLCKRLHVMWGCFVLF